MEVRDVKEVKAHAMKDLHGFFMLLHSFTVFSCNRLSARG